MGFLVDSSGSISRNNWDKMKNFVSQTISQVMKDSDGNRFAAVVYSTDADLVFDFKKLGEGATHSDFDSLVQKMKHLRGFTFIDKALKLASEEVFTAGGGMRQDVAKVDIHIHIYYQYL